MEQSNKELVIAWDKIVALDQEVTKWKNKYQTLQKHYLEMQLQGLHQLETLRKLLTQRDNG